MTAMRLSQDLEIALTVAVTEAGRLGHEYAGPEHLLYALTFDEATSRVLRHAGTDLHQLRRQIGDLLDDEPRERPQRRQRRAGREKVRPREIGEAGAPRLSLGLRRALEWAAAHAEAAGKSEIRGADVLVAMLSEVDSQAVELLGSQGVTRLDVVSFLAHGVSKPRRGPASRRGQAEDPLGDEESARGSTRYGTRGGAARRGAGDARGGAGAAPGSELEEDEALPAPRDADEALAAFTQDLTELGRRGAIDPLIGRENELARTLHILQRRRKNNPIYVGDPGVGKTALVEGLALRIAQGEVPAAFRETRIYRLDLGALLAGTRYRGDFENRLKAVLAALAAQPSPVLFIDEIHNLIGAGSAGRGTMDASNLLKPALQHGGLRCIGATTWEEFRQSFERDQALARRFQKVEVQEPSVEETVRIFGGLRSRYEEHHGVRYTGPAVAAAAELASRYLRDRRLPDSAIDLLDEAGATVALATTEAVAGAAAAARPGTTEEIGSTAAEVPVIVYPGDGPAPGTELDAPGNGTAAPGEAGDSPTAAVGKSAGGADGGAGDAGEPAGAAAGQGAPGADGGAGEPAVVDVAEVETVLATMAQIPAQRVQGDDRERLRGLRDELGKAIFGQDQAVERLVAAIQVARAGLRDRDRPVGCFLLTGPTGVGKTEMARQLALALGISFLRFDMSEYMERHTVSRLVGAPPGYVGFDRGGLLTEAVAKNPHAVLLLDEVEKAHEDVFNLLLQVMDHGTLTDTNGKRTDFRHVILLMTSNLGAREMARRPFGFAAATDEDAGRGEEAPGGSRPVRGGRETEAERAFEHLFSPEFRNRLDARLQFRPLSREVMEKIVDKLIAELAAQLAPKGVRLELTREARRLLAERGHDPAFGARPLARVLDETVKRPLTQELLFGALQAGGTAVVEVPAGEPAAIVVRCRA
jgi:ATP-dependent Clp protease ATP-binding subunit ClpA